MLLLTLTLIASAIVSCKPALNDGSTASSSRNLESLVPDDQVLVFWYPYTQDHEEVLLEMVDAFNSGNKWGITVIAEHGGSTDDIYTKVSDRLGSSVLPDIVVAEPYQVAAYAEQDTLVALEPYLTDFKWGYPEEEEQDFFRALLIIDELPTLKGRYSWPLYRSLDVLYYNEDWLVELGYTEPPGTWDAFTEMACAASDPELDTYGYELSADAATFVGILFSMDGQVIDDDATGYAFGGPEGLGTLTLVRDLLEESCAALKTKAVGDRIDFGAGRVLFAIDSTSDLLQYHRAVDDGAGFNWSIVPLPTTLESPMLYMYGSDLAILKSTPERQLAAWLFLKWLTEPEQQAHWARQFNYTPVRASTIELVQDVFVESPQYEKTFDFLEYDIAIEPGVAGYGECRTAIERMLRATASLGNTTTGLAEAVEECNRSLNRAAQQ
jgi:multiple sugar transport system substrate-binding protein/sn-glycerol 3-phosphate transport system substrate-binding protein